MNPQTANRASGAAVGFLIVSVIFAVLVVGVKLLLIQPPIDAARAGVRTKALAEIHATEEKALNNAAWIDQQRGVVRLPIDTALQLAAQQWQNPVAARAELTARAEKAAAELPKAPEKPSAFE
jgi:hypothetical protein